MGNCLVTKLKGVVDNNTLPKYGEYKITLRSSNGSNIYLGEVYVRNTQTFRIVEGTGNFTTTQGDVIGKEISITNNGSIYYNSTTDLVVYVSGKYGSPNTLDGITGGVGYLDIDASEFKYIAVTDLNFNNNLSRNYIKGDIADLTVRRTLRGMTYIGETTPSGFGSFIEKFNTAGANLWITVPAGSPCAPTSILDSIDRSNLPNLDIMRGEVFSGDIAKIGYFKISDFYTVRAGAILYTGTLEGMIANLLTHNPDGGKFKFADPQNYVNVTYKGESLATQKEVLKQDPSFINYDAQGNITWTAS